MKYFKLQHEISNDILELVAISNGVTQSDLQGISEVLAKKIIDKVLKESKK